MPHLKVTGIIAYQPGLLEEYLETRLRSYGIVLGDPKPMISGSLDDAIIEREAHVRDPNIRIAYRRDHLNLEELAGEQADSIAFLDQGAFTKEARQKPGAISKYGSIPNIRKVLGVIDDPSQYEESVYLIDEAGVCDADITLKRNNFERLGVTGHNFLINALNRFYGLNIPTKDESQGQVLMSLSLNQVTEILIESKDERFKGFSVRLDWVELLYILIDHFVKTYKKN